MGNKTIAATAYASFDSLAPKRLATAIIVSGNQQARLLATSLYIRRCMAVDLELEARMMLLLLDSLSPVSGFVEYDLIT